MNKAELLKEKAKQNSMNLYLSNSDEVKTSNNVIPPQPKQDDTEVSIHNQKKEKENQEQQKQMLSFRIPKDIIEKIGKYAYIERMTKQDVIIKGLSQFFDDKDAIEKLKQFDTLKKNN